MLGIVGADSISARGTVPAAACTGAYRMRPYGGRAISSGVQRRGPLYFLSFISYLFSRNEVCQLQQLKQKKIPVRRCVGCNAQRPKRELVRVVRSPEGEISIDLRGKAPGRGAYLCPSAACLAKARKAKRLERTFEVPIPDGIYDRLTEEIACAEQSAKEAASHE